MTARLIDVQQTENVLELSFEGGKAGRFPLFWLRDHCGSAESLNPDTAQREHDTTLLAAAPQITATALEDDGRRLVITWSDGHASPLAADLLLRVLPSHTSLPERIFWSSEDLNHDPAKIGVAYEAVMDGDEGLQRWLETIWRYGFAFVLGTPATGAATEELIRRIAYIRETIFGGFWEFTADQKHADSAYSNQELGLHTDGTYSHDAPGLQMLHCLHFDGTGAESVMADGFRVAQDMKAENPAGYDLLTKVEVPGRYLGDGVHLEARRPALRLNPKGELLQVSYNNYDRAPFLLPEAEMAEFYDAYLDFGRRLKDPKYHFVHTLRPGEAMIFDNWRALHARKAYQGQRRLCGAYLNHEDFESRLRLLAG
ncbi:trimethyllysine dioxygenase [Rhodovibrionaceae bacterium A322]